MSNCGNVFGCHGAVFHYWQACVGGFRAPPPSAQPRMQSGTDAEPFIRIGYSTAVGEPVVAGETFIPATGAAAVDAALIASTDGRTAHTSRLVEIKFPEHGLYSERTHAHGVPLYYLYQMMGQMALSGHRCCDFVALCAASRECRVVRVYYSERLWSWMWPKLVLFRDWCARKVFPREGLDFRYRSL